MPPKFKIIKTDNTVLDSPSRFEVESLNDPGAWIMTVSDEPTWFLQCKPDEGETKPYWLSQSEHQVPERVKLIVLLT